MVGAEATRKRFIDPALLPAASAVAATPDFQALKEAMKTPQQKALESMGGEEKRAAEGLGKIAQLVLQIDARSFNENPEVEKKVKEEGRKRLAASLGTTPEDLQLIVDDYGEKWQEFILEERIRANVNSVGMRDISWDRLESAVLTKLLHLVDTNLVSGVPELLAIAKAANAAQRGERRPTSSAHGVGNQTNIFLPGAPSEGVLPAGNLGKISLNLTRRVVKQIEGEVVQPGESNDPFMQPSRKLDSIEMMTIEEIQVVGEELHRKGEES